MNIFDFASPWFQPFWTISLACLVSVSCSILGCFLLVKRLCLLGDGISHGVLPGIAVAVLLTGQVSGVHVFFGAMAFGVLTAFLTERISAAGKLSEDASLGIVFTTLFAIGVILISHFLRRLHVDTDCVLYGLLDGIDVRVNHFTLGAIPSAAFPIGTSFVLTITIVAVLWKEMKIVAFDASLARTMGFSPTTINYLLIGLVTANIVTAFEAVGSVIVLSMLVAPAASAFLCAERFSTMVWLSAGFAATASILGCLIAAYGPIATSSPGMMAVTAAGLFILAGLFAPKQGWIVRAIRYFRLSSRIAQEEILAGLYRLDEAGRSNESLDLRDHGLSRPMIAWSKFTLRRRGLIANRSGQWTLTDTGKLQARELVRVHRLLESYAGAMLDLPPDHVHAPASRFEHFIGPALLEELARALNQPLVDPQGKPIPPPDHSSPQTQ